MLYNSFIEERFEHSFRLDVHVVSEMKIKTQAHTLVACNSARVGIKNERENDEKRESFTITFT
jgi:hypothetical protein